MDHTKCIGVEEFLFYSINWEIKGLPLGDENMTDVLSPISRVSMATSIDFHAGKNLPLRLRFFFILEASVYFNYWQSKCLIYY